MSSKKARFTMEQIRQAQRVLDDLTQLPIKRFEGDEDLAFELAAMLRQIKPETETLNQNIRSLMRECGAVSEGNLLVFTELTAQQKYHDEYERRLAQVERPMNIQPVAWSRLRPLLPDLPLGHIAFGEGIVFVRDTPSE